MSARSIDADQTDGPIAPVVQEAAPAAKRDTRSEPADPVLHDETPAVVAVEAQTSNSDPLEAVVSEPVVSEPVEPDAVVPGAERPKVEPEVDSPPLAAHASAPLQPGSTSTADEALSATSPDEEKGRVGRPVEGAAAWRRLLRMGLPRATKANVLGGLLATLLGLAIATQVQLTQERGLSELSQTDLIRVLDDVSSRSSRLDAQIRELEATRDRLKSGTGSSAEALEQAQKRADTLGILAGTVGATGPGISITLSDPQEALTAPIILDLVQELRDAGAEAIDVGGVRVVASSFVGEVDGTITIDGKSVSRPIRITAIGDSKTLSSAMTIPGGIVETVRQKGASATVVEQDTVEITSLHAAQEPKIAKVAQ